nr:hypothetical protein [uncultured Marinobacter sp.]
MARFFTCLLIGSGILPGCAFTPSQTIDFRTTNNARFESSSDQFGAVDIRPFETRLWRANTLVGSITTLETDPDFSTAIGEVKQGFHEATKGPGKPELLELPDNAFGFSVSCDGYTTAFIATRDRPESWFTISVLDETFDEVISSLTAR